MARLPLDDENAENQPLLRSPRPSSPSSSKTSNFGSDSDDASIREAETLRAVEFDVLPETATYGRNLGWWSAYILIMSRVIGSGIFATPGSIAKSVGSVGLTLVLWVVGAIISACALAITMEYGCMLPRSGGEKVYLEFTYRHPRYLASTLVAVQAVLLGFTASNCIVFGEYVLFALDIEPTEFIQKTLAVGLLTAITIIHGCFLKTGIIIQDALGTVKIALCAFMGLTGLYVVIFRPNTASGVPPNTDIFVWDNLWRDSNWSWGILSTALFKVFYSYAGLNNVNNVLNEVKNPVRTLRTVGPAALFTACCLYLLVNVAYFVIVPIEELKESQELVAALFFEKVFGQGFGKTVLPLFIAISAVGNVMVVTYAMVTPQPPADYSSANYTHGPA
jgi:amino acid transporter